MNRQAAPHPGELSGYEAEQVRRIAAWKSKPATPLAELWNALTMPAARAVEKLVPDRLTGWLIERLDDGAELLAGQEDIKRRAGVHDLAELRERPLEECDRNAREVGLGARAIAAAEGAATGAGGAWTTLLDVPLLFGLALRTIRKIGHCYGDPLDGSQGRALALAILATALSGSLDVRRQRLRRLRELEEIVFDEAEEEVLTQEIVSFVFQLEAFEEVPGVGAVSGAALNLVEIVRVDVTARRIFQERWLRAAGKIPGVIEPADAHPLALAPGVSGALARLAYSGCYSVGYGVVMPLYASAVVLGQASGILARGLGRALPQARAASRYLNPSRGPAPVPAA